VFDETVIPKGEILDFDMKAGDALVFFNTTLHASKPHVDNTSRKAISVRYLLEGAKMTGSYINATPPFDKMGIKVVDGAPVPENFPKLW